VVKQKGMVFGFWKTATAVVGPEIEVVVVVIITFVITFIRAFAVV
jgi:hypothetical protein